MTIYIYIKEEKPYQPNTLNATYQKARPINKRDGRSV
jgi:hypothetical protein